MPSARLITKKIFHRVGGMHLLRHVNRAGLRILLYHRFPHSTAAGLERQCAHLRRYYHVMSLTDAAINLQSDRPLPKNSVVVTVDDGYRDFYTVAGPIFSKYQIPAMMFLTTSFVDRTLWLWGDQVRYALERSGEKTAEIPIPGGETMRFSLATAEHRENATSIIKEALKRVPNCDRVKLVNELPRLLKIRIPEVVPDEYEPLSWDEIRLMARAGMEFGAHTTTHPILSRSAGAEELKAEIEGSRNRISEELQDPVAHFSYPNGLQDDIDPRVVEHTRRAGFQTAVTAQPGLNFPSTDRFLLRRITVESGFDDIAYHQTLAGFP